MRINHRSDNKRRRARAVALLMGAVILLLVACGGGDAEPTADPQLELNAAQTATADAAATSDAAIATNVAATVEAQNAVDAQVATSVAATLAAQTTPTPAQDASATGTAEAAAAAEETVSAEETTAADQNDAAVATLQAESTASAAATVAAEEAVSATATAEAAATATAVAAIPTPPVFILQGAPGDRDGLTGDVFTIEGVQSDPDTQTFRDSIVFLVKGVYAEGGDAIEGAGVKDVRFTITDANGDVVHVTTEENPLYCAFGGGEPNCNIWVFADNAYRWPSGAPVRSGPHNAVIEGQGVNPDQIAIWLYDFNIALPDVTPPQDNTARIDSITLDGDRYVVDFETFGFEPQAGAQHVHFFFNTVPPEKAGVGEPDAGPWQLYPTGPGQPNSSPFTLLGPADRPAEATAMCILVANADHSVIQGTGNCVALP